MNEQRGSGFEDFGRKVDEKVKDALPRVEAEVKRVITYLNDEVVPDVRRNSSKALRAAAEQLAKLADNLEHRNGGRSGL
jgi:sulfur carrier protein ThiS